MRPDISENGIHLTKKSKDMTRSEVVPVSYYCPDHDFSNDAEYERLTRPLTYRDIELAKMHSMGGRTGAKCAREICPDLSPRQLQYRWQKSSEKPGFKELLGYLTKLCYEQQFGGKMDNDRLMSIAEQSVQIMKPGAQRFNAAMKLIEYREREIRRKQGGENNTDPTSEAKYDDAMAEMLKLTGPGDANGQQL